VHVGTPRKKVNETINRCQANYNGPEISTVNNKKKIGDVTMEPKMIDEKKKLLAKLERKEKILAKRLEDIRDIIAVLKAKK
jgi:hypothetical protein